MKDDDKLAMILAQLRWLKLPGMARALEALLARATKTNMTPLDIVGALADAEKASRIESAIKRRVRDAGARPRPATSRSATSASSSAACARSCAVLTSRRVLGIR